MNLYTKCTAKPYSFLVIDVTLASDNPLRFMAIDDKIRDEKLGYDIQREAAKYQHYHLESLINMNILQVKKYYLLIKEE